MGAVADIVNMGDWTRMRMWVLAMGVAMIGFNAMVALGWIDAGESIYAAPRVIWLSALVGGALFGFGMVLGSGCGSKTLVRDRRRQPEVAGRVRRARGRPRSRH